MCIRDRVHPEENFVVLNDWINADKKRNVCSKGDFTYGDVDEELSKCAHIIEQTLSLIHIYMSNLYQ